MPISAIRGGMPCALRTGEEQTKVSLYTRIGTAVLGALTALIGALIVSGVINLSAIGTIAGGSLIGVGGLIVVVALGLQCAQKKIVLPPPTETKSDGTGKPPKTASEQLEGNTWFTHDSEANKQFIRNLDPSEYPNVQLTTLPTPIQKDCYEALKGDDEKVLKFFYKRAGVLIELLDEKGIARLLGDKLLWIPESEDGLTPDLRTKYLKAMLKPSDDQPGAHFRHASILLSKVKLIKQPEGRQTEYKKIFNLLFEIKFDLAGFFKKYDTLFPNEDQSQREIPLFYIRKLLQEGLGATLLWDMVGPNEWLLKNIASDLTPQERGTLKNWLLVLPPSADTKVHFNYLN